MPVRRTGVSVLTAVTLSLAYCACSMGYGQPLSKTGDLRLQAQAATRMYNESGGDSLLEAAANAWEAVVREDLRKMGLVPD